MSKLKFLRMKLHEILGLHDFALVRHGDWYTARCSCGAFLKRWR